MIAVLAAIPLIGIGLFFWRRPRQEADRLLYGSILFGAIDESVIVIGQENQLVDINPAALRLFGLADEKSQNLTGRPVQEVLGRIVSQDLWSDLLEGTGTLQKELHVCDQPPLYLEVQITPWIDQQNRMRGRLLLAHDITRHKLSEAAEKEAHELAEALRNTSAALNSSLDIEQVLDQILENVQRVMQCETANLMMIEGKVARTVRRIGSTSPEVTFALAETPNLLQMIETRQPIAIPDVRSWPGWVDTPVSAWIRSYAAAPIVVAGDVIGFINLDSPTRGTYDQIHAGRLKVFADQAAIAIHNARLFSRVAELATLDELTGLSNRRNFFIQAGREVSRALRYNKTLSAIMIDLDHFKQINDRFGHPLGDQVLQNVGKVLRSEVRVEDLVGRYGGEEFAILLPETGCQEALVAAERLRARIAAMEVPTVEGLVTVTASLGVASLQPGCDSLEDLLKLADQALYLAKEKGRNRVERTE